MKYQVTARARREVADIWEYIARDSEHHANEFLSELKEHFRLLGENPRMGRQRDELRLGMRSFPVGEYVILYRITRTGVRISHVIHGRRDLSDFYHN